MTMRLKRITFTTDLELLPTHNLLIVLFLILQVSMTSLVKPEGIRIEERLATEGAHQPHSQMYLSHRGTNCSTRG